MTPDGSTLQLRPVRSEPLAPRAARPPRLAPGLVPRPRLLRRLTAARDVPVVLIAAPAGYGKTTLLAEWAGREERRFEWVPGHLLQLPGDGERLLERLGEEGPAVVVVDDAEHAAAATIDELADAACRLPPGCTLALASRRPLGPRVARLRAHRLVLALGSAELAMTSLEAALLLQAAGLRLDGEAVDRLVTRTQGWPAILAIAAEVLAEQPEENLGGADRVLAEYLRGQVLAELPAHRLAFLRRTSILPELTPRLCDAILGRGDASRVLEAIARADFGLEPVGRLGDRYRLHPLVRELLRSDLERLEPGLGKELHRRAAAWHGRHGPGEAAVEHAIAAGEPAAAGHALWALAPGRAVAGRSGKVESWLYRFPDRDVAAHPELAMTAAAVHLAEGRLKEAERWTATAEAGARATARGPARTAALALLRACAGSGGISEMGADAARAAALMPPEQPWQALASLLRGAARHLSGDREAARALLARAARPGPGELALVRALAHAQLALLEADGGDWESAAAAALAARAQLESLAPAQGHATQGQAAAPPASGLVYVAAAVTAAHAGDLPEAREAADRARKLLAGDAGMPAWLAVECEVWLAQADIRLSDAAAARALLARAARLLRAADDAPALAAWLHAGWERADAFAVGATGELPALTTAELRVLRFLPSHLTFREIGDRLHVSANTVKTQALAAYRKLDVGCRSEAVARGRAVGLIDG